MSHAPLFALCATLAATALPAQDSLLFFSRYDSTSLDASAGGLGGLRPFDISVVTPGSGAAAHPWIPSSAIAAVTGDADGDTTMAEFAGLPQASWGLGAPFVKQADKASADPRRVFWSITEQTTSPPTVTVFDGTSTHVVRKGDWVRILDNGDVEFFIRQDHFTKAIGAQTGSWVAGANAICQASDGSIYYSPAYGISSGGSVAGGHWVSDGMTSVFAYDGAICYIPAAAITYDANGNVQDVAADSARLVINEIGVGPGGEFSVRDMCAASGAVDNLGQPTAITFWMIGIEIDPNGGTFKGWFDQSVDHPNLIFTFENIDSTCCGGLGSWQGTIFSTAPNTGGTMGSIAVINGVTMGATSLPAANGSWTGIVQGSGAASAPVLRGLATVSAGWASNAPYGSVALHVANDGLVSLASDPNIRLSQQGLFQGFPSALVIGGGPAPGGRPTAFPLPSLGGGWSTVHTFNGGPIGFGLFVGDTSGRAFATLPVPTGSPGLLGASLIWQTFSLGPMGNLFSNPVVTEIRP